jgi:hypothetical protein
MSKPLSDRLYRLLPAIYRIQDAKPAQGEALRVLMGLIEQQFLELEADIDQLYDDWFIETCQEWLVPYLGDLLGVRSLQSINAQSYSQRAYVANTLAYRQRKGTASVLEQLARDVTNWPARSVEFFERLSATPMLNHLRPANVQTPNLRDTNALELLGSPFETANHLPEVRQIANGRGRYNIPNVGLFLWRLQSYPLAQVTPRAVSDDPSLGLYWINPLGQDQTLFNTPNPETAITTLATEANVPAPLRRRPLYEEIEALVRGVAQAEYFNRTPVFQVFLDGLPLAPTELIICDLSGEPNQPDSSWQRPTLALAAGRRIALDPVLGRLAIPQAQPLPATLAVSYAYGFSGDIGGGAYDRRDSIDPAFLRRVTWQVGVSRSSAAVGTERIFTRFADAIAAWNTQPANTTGLIALLDNDSYATEITNTAPILLPENSELLLVAADWPTVASELPGVRDRRPQQITPVGRRVHLRGDLFVQGTAASESANPGRLRLNGLLVEGRVTVQPGHLGELRLTHCTLVPSSGGLWVEAAEPEVPEPEVPEPEVPEPEVPEPEIIRPTNRALQVILEYSISGSLYLAETVAQLSVSDSLIDAEAGHLLLSLPLSFPLNGEVQVRSGRGEPATLAIAAADLETARSNLETALQIVLPSAQVAQFGDRLIVSGQPGDRLSFSATASDPETVNRLGLNLGTAAIAALSPNQAAPLTTLERSTILGSVYVQALQLASDVIFTAPVLTQRQQIGCVRFSYLPPQSQVPRRYRCQPDLSIAQQFQARQTEGTLTVAEETLLRDRLTRQVVPNFTSTRYGEPAYGQLSQVCPTPIRTGAADGSEMGAFNLLQQPQREANLRLTLSEYLRFGLQPGLFFIT